MNVSTSHVILILFWKRPWGKKYPCNHSEANADSLPCPVFGLADFGMFDGGAIG